MSRRLIVRPEAEEGIDNARLEYEGRVRGLSLDVLQPESIVVAAVLHTSRSPKLLRAILIRERSRRQGVR